MKCNKIELTTPSGGIIELSKDYIKMGDKINLDLFRFLKDSINEYTDLAVKMFGHVDYLAELKHFDRVYEGLYYSLADSIINILVADNLVLSADQANGELILFDTEKCSVISDLNKIKQLVPDLSVIGSMINKIDTKFREYKVTLDEGERLNVRIVNDEYLISINDSLFIPLAEIDKALKQIKNEESKTKEHIPSKRERLGLRKHG